MIYNLYSYFDRVSGVYSSPMPSVNRASAIRGFIHNLENAPEKLDMELYEVGTFNVSDGSITGVERPVFVCRYEEYVNKEAK